VSSREKPLFERYIIVKFIARAELMRF